MYSRCMYACMYVCMYVCIYMLPSEGTRHNQVFAADSRAISPQSTAAGPIRAGGPASRTGARRNMRPYTSSLRPHTLVAQGRIH